MYNRRELRDMLITALNAALIPHGWSCVPSPEGKTIAEDTDKIVIVDYGDTSIALRDSGASPEKYPRSNTVADAEHTFTISLLSRRRDDIENVLPAATMAVYNAGTGAMRRFNPTAITGGVVDVEKSQLRQSEITVAWTETLNRSGVGV